MVARRYGTVTGYTLGSSAHRCPDQQPTPTLTAHSAGRAALIA
jgi:hypothetical protein